MYAQQQYPPGAVPSGFPHDFRGVPMSPPPGTHSFASPIYRVATATPSPRGSPKTHSRRASHAPPGYTSQSRVPPHFYAESGSSPRYYTPNSSTPLRNQTENASPRYSAEPEATPEPYSTPLKANSTRPRRASHSSRPNPPKPKSASAKKETRKATEEDARRAGIPAGYSYKNWDPSEEPITLLGSVFDANSLGRWIYDWTVFSYGPATPMSDVAGDLWLLLIQLAGKVKRADEGIEKIRQEENRELVEDFLESGERLWVRFKKLLKICEDYMWKAAQRDSGEKRPMAMGKNSGCEFVDSIFGRDRELDKTEKLMSAIRLWSMRFDANCDEILRNPTV
ncbi:hypothetical protein EJ06DRAFT_384826 [Trichodelitschia bisporula]|uniref:Vegetative cell wall protein gp1 n=1 Tax=Trichodelitschia bisporula TaxID=703511 RepID=A0A6G1HZE2_9PEZI|nr:hypothetical protein EJ06DRAFT_384826 [Trichodelitschia bisporula]